MKLLFLFAVFALMIHLISEAKPAKHSYVDAVNVFCGDICK